MKIFISLEFRKKLNSGKSTKDKIKRFNEICQKIENAQTTSQLDLLGIGFKDFKGIPGEPVFGIDFNYASAERIIASLIHTPEDMRYFFGDNKKILSILMHTFTDHDNQEDEAKKVADKSFDLDDFTQLGAYDQDQLDKSIRLKSFYYQVYPNVVINAVLTEDKDKIVHDFIYGSSPTAPSMAYIVPGIAGSGKTEIAIKILRTLSNITKDKRIAYVTVSNELVRKVEGQVQSTNPNVSFHTLQSIIAKIQNKSTFKFSSENTLYDFYNSSEIRDVNFNLQIKRVVDNYTLDRIYAEINGTLFGSIQLSYKKDKIKIMSLNDYLGLPLEKSIFALDERKMIHRFAVLYTDYLEKKNTLEPSIESLDIIHSIGTSSFNAEHFLDYLIIDEIQDLTEVQFYMLFKLLKNKTQLFLTGDPNQAINPTAFDLANIKRILYSSNTESVLSDPLNVNCRNSIAITAIINAVNDFRNEKITRRKIEYTRDEENKNFIPGNVYFLENDLESIRHILDGSNIAIVTDSKRKKEIQEKFGLKSNLFTVQEIKGLEYENVVVVDLLSSHKELMNSIYDSKKIKDNSLHYYFNLFYVAITRAQKNLILIESSEIKLLEEIKNSSRLKHMISKVKKIEAAELSIDSTAEGFFEKGTQFLKNGNYDRANDCFEMSEKKNPNLAGLKRAINAFEIYINTETTDEKLAAAFEKEEYFELALNHYSKVNNHRMIVLMKLAMEDIDGFERDITRFEIDILDLYGIKQNYDKSLDGIFSKTILELGNNNDLLYKNVCSLMNQ